MFCYYCDWSYRHQNGKNFHHYKKNWNANYYCYWESNFYCYWMAHCKSVLNSH